MSDADFLLLAGSRPSSQAFATVVQRHLPLVYSTALRHVGSPDLARDVSQRVFLEFAASLPRLRPDTHLGSWLYVVTRRRAVDLMRREKSRLKHEAIAVQLADTAASDISWAAVRPQLDDVLDELRPEDREAVVRRYFESEPWRAIATALGVSEDAAQKRVARALESLRTRLARRGITATAAALAATLTAHAMTTAPAGLGGVISQAAAPALAVTPIPTALTVAGSFARAALLPLATLAVTGGLLWLVHARQNLDLELAQLHSEDLSWSAAVQREAAANLTEPAPAPPPTAPDPLAAQADRIERRIHRLQTWLAKPGYGSPVMSVLSDEDWILRANAADELDDYGLGQAREKQVVYAILWELYRKAASKLHPDFAEAAKRFRAATGRPKVTSVADLIPYLPKPIDPAILGEFWITSDGQLWSSYLHASGGGSL